MSNPQQVIKTYTSTKKYSYSKGVAVLNFSLRVDIKTELRDFLEILKVAIKEVESDINKNKNMLQYFAQLNENNIVTKVIVADQDFIDSGKVGDPSTWIETFVNGSERKNYAGTNYTYDRDIDAFIPPSPHASWVLNEEKCLWDAPIPKPEETDKRYKWDEATTSWKEVDLSKPNQIK